MTPWGHLPAADAANQRRAALRGGRTGNGSASDGSEGDYYHPHPHGGEGHETFDDERIFPFELEMLEGALMVATGEAALRRLGLRGCRFCQAAGGCRTATAGLPLGALAGQIAGAAR